MLRFSIPGNAVSKQRPRISTKNGIVRAYTPANTAKYEKFVADISRLNLINDKFLGPVSVKLLIFLEQAKSNKDLFPVTRPDIDNYAKSLLDGMNGVVYADDSQIVDLQVQLRYGLEARVEVLVSEFI